MRKARLLISGTHVQECFPLPRAVSTHRFFPKRGLPGILMKPTHPCPGPLESKACPIHPSVLVPGAQEVAGWEVQDDTWVGHHRQGQNEVAGPYYLDGSAFNPVIVELRRAGRGSAVLEHPEPSTLTVVLVAPSCLDASDDDAMEEEWLEDQMQEILEIDHAEAAMIDEPAREPKLIMGRFGCVAGDHTVPHAEHISPSCGAACFAILEG